MSLSVASGGSDDRTFGGGDGVHNDKNKSNSTTIQLDLLTMKAYVSGV